MRTTLALALLAALDFTGLDAAPPAPDPAPAPPPTVSVSWSRVDSRGVTWSYPDRALLDAHVDLVEWNYRAAPVTPYVVAPVVAAPVYYAPPGMTCAGGACYSPAVVPTIVAPGRGPFGRR